MLDNCWTPSSNSEIAVVVADSPELFSSLMSRCNRALQTDIAFWQYGIASWDLEPISRHKHIRKFLNCTVKAVTKWIRRWNPQNAKVVGPDKAHVTISKFNWTRRINKLAMCNPYHPKTREYVNLEKDTVQLNVYCLVQQAFLKWIVTSGSH